MTDLKIIYGSAKNGTRIIPLPVNSGIISFIPLNYVCILL